MKARLLAETETILENVKRIQQCEGKVPQIELDVLLDSIRGMYVSALELNKLNALQNDVDRIAVVKDILQQVVATETVNDIVAEVETPMVAVETEPVQEPESVVEEPVEETPTVMEAEPMVSEELVEEPVMEESELKDDKFEELVESVDMLKEIVGNDILSNSPIMAFEPIDDGDDAPMAEEEPQAEESKADVVEEEQSVEVKTEEEPAEESQKESESVAVEQEQPVVEESIEESMAVEQVQPVVEEPIAVEQVQPVVEESIEVPVEVQTKEEHKPVAGGKHHEEPRQTSLFDYLKSTTVTKAAEQVDRFSGGTVTTLADKFQQAKERERLLFGSNISNEERKQPRVKDLRSIIGVSDKFLFINELFGKNMRAYTEFIMKLTNMEMDATDEALAYLKTIEEQYGWDKESLAVQTFIKIFERKFK